MGKFIIIYTQDIFTAKEIILLSVGAIFGLFITILFQYFSGWWFGFTVLRKRKGNYSITLKNGKIFGPIQNGKVDWNFKMGKKIKIEGIDKEGLSYAVGEIVFSSKNYGRGFYKHLKDGLFGIYELTLLPNNEIAVLRKYTSDTKSEERPMSDAIETSFLWKKK